MHTDTVRGLCAALDAGEASLAFVVEAKGAVKTPMTTYVYPESARKVVRHWESLWDACDPPGA
jgi:hypothetical protein